MRKSQWQLQDAKARFSQVVEAALQGEPQHVTRRGQEAVVVLSEASYRALRKGRRANPGGFVGHLLAVPKEGASAHVPSHIALRDIDL